MAKEVDNDKVILEQSYINEQSCVLDESIVTSSQIRREKHGQHNYSVKCSNAFTSTPVSITATAAAPTVDSTISLLNSSPETLIVHTSSGQQQLSNSDDFDQEYAEIQTRSRKKRTKPEDDVVSTAHDTELSTSLYEDQKPSAVSVKKARIEFCSNLPVTAQNSDETDLNCFDADDQESETHQEADFTAEVQSAHSYVSNGAAVELTPKRWSRAQALAEEYIELASNIVLYYPPDFFGPFGYDPTDPVAPRYPLEAVSALAYLKHPARRPTVLEKWSPYEIGLFEGAIAQHGKYFHRIANEIQSKNTKQVVDFYYIWKKAAPRHYQQWKQTYVPENAVIEESNEEDNNDDKSDKDDKKVAAKPKLTNTTTTGKRGRVPKGYDTRKVF